jgi:hypothetical protein
MPRKKKARPMSEPAPITPEVIKEKVDLKNDVRLEISGPGDGQTLHLFIKAPILAEVIRKMATGNYPLQHYADVYKPILLLREDAKDRVVTRPAIARATKNFVGGTDFDWNEAPRTPLLANPDMLAEGFTLIVKQDKPVPPDILRRWGKQFMDGCADIIQNARAFKMSWVMQETPKVG